MAAFNGVLYVGGTQSSAMWNGQSWQPIPNVAGSIQAIVSSSERLIIGGHLVVNGVTTSVAVYDGSTWTALGPPFDQPVVTLLDTGPLLVAGGDFTSNNGVQLRGVAKWDGLAWEPMGPGLSGAVRTLTLHDGFLHAGGSFTASGSAELSRVARWDGSSWVPVGQGFNNTVNAMRSFQGKLYASGSFTASATGDPRYLGVLEQGAWRATGFQPLQPGNALEVVGAELLFGSSPAGFSLDYEGGNLARMTPEGTWTTFQTGLGGSMSHEVRSLWSDGEQVYAGGTFTEAAGDRTICKGAIWRDGVWERLLPGDPQRLSTQYPTSFLALGGDLLMAGYPARLDTSGVLYGPVLRRAGDSWSSFLQAFNATSPAYLCEWQGSIFIAGTFNHQTAPFQAAANIIRWNGQAFSPVTSSGSSGGANNAVNAVLPTSSGLVIAGVFTSVDGQPANRVARWNGASWSAMGQGLDGPVTQLIQFNDDIVAAGSFQNSGSSPTARVARWDGAGWVPLGAGFDGPVHALTVFEGTLIAGGEFGSSGTTALLNIARWNGNGWEPFAGGANGGVRALTVHRGELIVGGKFTRVGSHTSVWFARARPCCGPSDFNGDGDFGTDQDIEAFFACLGGSCCETCWVGGADFNGDGDTGTDQDIESFFRVLGGGPC